MSAQRSVRFASYGDPQVLEVGESPVPEPGPGQARVRVQASSVQYTDTLIRRGLYPDLKDKPPLVPGYDLVGVVDAVGEGVSEVQVGDRVADLCVVGGNARYALRSSEGLVPVPAAVDAAEAATLVLSWVTAQQALFRTGGLETGQKLLVIGGNGAVGLAAIPLAVRAGVEVWVTAAERHHQALEARGARVLPRDGWAEQTRSRFDVVLDGVGAHGFRDSSRAVRRGGKLVAIGISAAVATGSRLTMMTDFASLGLRWLWPDGRRVSFYNIGTQRSKHPGWFTEDLRQLLDLLERGEIHPEVAERLSLDQVADAHQRLERGGVRGKLVLEPFRA